jgi:hypothetical protein
MRARHDWREAVENMSTDRLREVLERSESLNDYADVQMARMSEGRWLSNLRSAGILVVLQANGNGRLELTPFRHLEFDPQRRSRRALFCSCLLA